MLPYICAGIAILFLALAALRIWRDGGFGHPQTRAWLIVGVTFGAVSAYLLYQA